MKKPGIWIPMYGFYSCVGGAEKQLEKTAAELAKLGHKITVITAKINNTEKTFPENNFKIILLPFLYRGKNPVLKKLSSFIFLPELFVYLLWNHKKYDVLQNFFIDKYSFITIICGLILKKPVVIRESNSKGLKPGFMRKICYRVYNKAAAFIAISEQIRDEYIEFFNISSEKIVFIPNGVESLPKRDKFELREKLGLPKDKFIVINVGSLSQQKNHIKIFRTWKLIAQKKRDIILICLGDGQKKPELLRFIGENRLDSNIFLPGNRYNVPDYLQASDLFIFPSLWEGMPNALIEAMSAGLPCMASRIRANESVINNNKNGILFDLSIDDNRLADLIIQVSENFELMAELSYNAGIKAGEYSISDTALKYSNLYSEITLKASAQLN